MKKLHLILCALALTASALAAEPASPAILDQTTRNGVTTLVTTGRVQADAAINADGTVTFTVFPSVVRLDSAGEAIVAPALDVAAGFPVNLSAELVAAIMAEVKAAYLAKLAAAKAAKDAEAGK